MRSIRRGDSGPAVAEIRSILVGLELLETAGDSFDDALDTAVRAFQQSRGLGIDGLVGDETWGALDASRWRLGARTLFHSVPDALVGEDVRTLQERLLEMGFDSGRADSIYGPRTARAVAQFQREVGLTPDGSCGPQTMKALRRLGRKVVGGRPQWLREAEAFRQAGTNLVGKTIVIDPGHGGGDDQGVVVPDGPLRWSEADLVYDLANRLEGRLAAAGMRVHLTRGPKPAESMSGADRAALANSLGADLLISLHLDGHDNEAADGVATYHYGTGSGLSSTVGERLANLVQREIAVRTGLRDCRVHAKTWELLRLTRMPAVRVDLGYLTSQVDRDRLVNPLFREQIVEAILAAVQRMYYPVEADVPTGSIDVRQLRMALSNRA
ncbi:N-acetylmuramoyl-L-alanine amidase [Actinoplanes sp. LDG1-06]|uniref:N-acetylmuramoyl-L-alanine amidase n=1 Tax=Paractinoplanes ovalisporus TaxID=2810368 RepID=A0ABS2AAP1_9ACTN|nr:N-acetylmuramoyl-L-alanine amidase [Actinoplanes ovalisporus]MBM2616892.1 N-acetylmuramoyl-L-alanine amidase [Actinoplanes ovalisporus]